MVFSGVFPILSRLSGSDPLPCRTGQKYRGRNRCGSIHRYPAVLVEQAWGRGCLVFWPLSLPDMKKAAFTGSFFWQNRIYSTVK